MVFANEFSNQGPIHMELCGEFVMLENTQYHRSDTHTDFPFVSVYLRVTARWWPECKNICNFRELLNSPILP